MTDQQLPAFSTIKISEIEQRLRQQLEKNRQCVTHLLAKQTITPSLLLSELEQADDELEQLWSPISHLHGVKNSDELREVYSACLPLLTEYSTEMGQNKDLYQAYKDITASEEYASIDGARLKSIENALRDFTLSGIGLEDTKQKRFGEIKKRLADLSTQFSNNVLDATHGWSKHIEDVTELAGIPASVLSSYQQLAKAKDKTGYLISLDIPAYLPLMQYCDNAELRQEMYTAYTTRASDQGPNAGNWDNSSIMEEILTLRAELAKLLGFDNYSQRSLATKMADTPEQVLSFLNDLADKSLAVAEADFQELSDFAQSKGAKTLQAWDVPYYSEKLRLEKYALSQEELRPYFPADKVIDGLFTVANKLFDVSFEEVSSFDSWHPDVKLFEIIRDGNTIARFYMDIFAREHKRGGAWMADCRVRRRLPSGEIQLPVAFLVCNFTPPNGDTPSLLTHNEVTTLFHEFGHGLHHMLTEVECAAVSGINGVAWDAVELPSQFMENWCWEKEAIPLISGHYETGEPLPAAMLEKMLAAKNFQSGMFMVRQLEFSLFDMLIHSNDNTAKTTGDSNFIQATLDKVRKTVAVSPVPDFNRFQHGFSHIFAGGYAAGYYSYKWAEVLSADAFSRFEEEGIFNRETGKSFQQEILSRGGSQEPAVLFENFRGRKPSVEALLRHSGIS